MKKRKRLSTIVLFFLGFLFLMGVFGATPHAAEKIVLETGGESVVIVNGNGTVLIRGEEYRFDVLKKGKRLKLYNEGSNQGVLVKRFGTKIKVRDLQGNLLHFILKAGYLYKIKTGTGTELAMMKIEPDKVVITNRDASTTYTVMPEDGKIVCKRENGPPVFTLEGDTNPFPAAFFAMSPLSLPERVACYLMYR